MEKKNKKQINSDVIAGLASGAGMAAGAFASNTIAEGIVEDDIKLEEDGEIVIDEDNELAMADDVEPDVELLDNSDSDYIEITDDAGFEEDLLFANEDIMFDTDDNFNDDDILQKGDDDFASNFDDNDFNEDYVNNANISDFV